MKEIIYLQKLLFSLIFFLLGSKAQAFNCKTLNSNGLLNRVYSDKPVSSDDKNAVTVDFSLTEDGKLRVFFKVSSKSIFAKKILDTNEYPYQFDVVEVFISTNKDHAQHLPYFEIELSPYDQVFQVRVDDLKKPFKNGIDLDLEHHTEVSDNGWSGTLLIPLKKLNWDGDPLSIVGNAYSVLGQRHHREYWSLFLPKQIKPRFHLPEFFCPLLVKKN